ncbi:MAG: nucleoside phosphorylase [Clostridia bacterium]
MLLEQFDTNKLAVLNPDVFQSKVEGFPKIAMSIFDKELVKEIEQKYNAKQIGIIKSMTKDYPVYKINVGGTDIAFYQTPVGAAAAVGNFEEMIVMGVKSLLLVGCCGCLDAEIEDYSIIIPTSALRDEGASYHYLPASDEVEINKKCVNIIEDFMKLKNINYRKGKTWTTDALYRETKDKVEMRKKQGAITVDMECSAMASVAKFRGVNFGQFFYAADNLGAEEYDVRSLAVNELNDSKKKIISLAFECAVELDKKL